MKPHLLLLLLAAALPLHAADYVKHPHEPVDLAHDKNLYVVAYAHLDTQWRWTYVDSIKNDIRNTLEQNFALLDKYPNYLFNFTGSRRYEFMKEYYPEDYAKLKKYIAEGRWVPDGSSVDECDVNTPSLESLCRHFLYGNHYFEREFGTESVDFMLPDCFGFPASLPEIMAHARLKGFSTQKLTWGSAVGIPFNVGVWIGPDGSSVMAALNPGGYGSLVDEDLSKSPVWLKRIDDNGAKSGVYADFKYYGTGDQGGAPKASSVDWVERAIAAGSPIRVIEGSSDQIFRDIDSAQRAKLPTYKGELELINHSAGSISSEAFMKRCNRKNEQLANAAESAATAASWLGAFPYPYDDLYRAWDLVLGSQMHDIMPGTSIPKAYEYSWNDEFLALNEFAAITRQATAAVVSALDTRGEGIPVAVYNPLPIEREDPVEASIPVTGTAPDGVTAYDPQGEPVPTQVLGREHDHLRILFLAKAPSVGYAIYHIRPGAGAAASALSVTGSSLENVRYRVTLNTAGDIASIFDKSLNRELLSAPSRLSFHTENPAQYPAWNMDWEDRQKPARDFVSGPARIHIVESGPARVALEVRRSTENSTFVQQIRLAAGSAGDRVEILHKIDWNAFEASLKEDFPFTASNPNASFDDKVGVVVRGTDNPKAFELAQQQWMDLTNQDGAYGVSVLNDSKYGSDKPDDRTLRSTLLYTPGVRGGTPDQATQDHGRHQILIALAAHSGDWVKGGTPWQAARINQPLRAFLTPAHPGPLGKTFSLLSLNSSQVQVVAVKKAEDSDAVIIRLKELTGKPAAGLVLRFAGPIASAREVDAQERPIGPATVRHGALRFEMHGFGLRAFALKLAPPADGVAPVTSQPVALAFDTDVISSRAKRDDGSMDAAGDTYPAELFPAKLNREGVLFQFGSGADGAKNALSAHGQSIDLPAGSYNRVHLLAATADGDAASQIKIGDAEKPFDVPNWTGFIGQWDNRVWNPALKDRDPIGLLPGYVKHTPVAWFATHHNTTQGDAYYQFAYLFQLSYDLPKGAKTITLPDNPKIRVFAVSVSREPYATPPAAPLYDTLSDHKPGGPPIIPQAGQSFTAATRITLIPPLYHQPDSLHYTLDGSDPGASSPVYSGPFFAGDTVRIAAREIEASGSAGAVARGVVTIHDLTPPKLVSAMAGSSGTTLDLAFSAPLAQASATAAANYAIQPAIPVSKINLSPDGLDVTLSFAAPLTTGAQYTIALRGIKDASPAGNTVPPSTERFSGGNVVFNLAFAALPDAKVEANVPGLPLQPGDAWTINLFAKADAAPAERTLIGGFGTRSDTDGCGRYIAVFPEGIRFWASNHDVVTNSPFAVGRWQMLTATYDGKSLAVYKDGDPIGMKSIRLAADPDSTVSAGVPDPWHLNHLFKGDIQSFTIRRGALGRAEVKKLFDTTKPVR